jgi:hypothetical protein
MLIFSPYFGAVKCSRLMPLAEWTSLCGECITYTIFFIVKVVNVFLYCHKSVSAGTDFGLSK